MNVFLIKGTLPALKMIAAENFTEVSDLGRIFSIMGQKSYIQKKGPYRVGICLALSGSAIWYGRVQPYLNEIEFHEHYYIQGPSGCQGETIELCGDIGMFICNVMYSPFKTIKFNFRNCHIWIWDKIIRWQGDLFNTRKNYTSYLCAIART